MIDTETPRSPGWWLKILAKQLHDRRTGALWNPQALNRDVEARPGLDLLRAWLRGDPPLPVAAGGWQEGFREFLRMSRMNYAELAIEPTRHRMVPLGWRTAAAGDELGDAKALEIARANDFGVVFGDVAKDMLSLGDAYMIVGAPQENGIPLVTAQDPRQVITAHDAATGRTLAALNLFRDEWDSIDHAYVYLPGQVFKASRRSSGTLSAARITGRSWEWDEDASGPLPAGFEDVVPVVRFRNRDGVGDFESHLDVLTRINNTILDQVVIGKLQAFRQRAVKNLPQVDENDEAIDYTGVFDADPGSFWQVPDGVEFWESQTVDLGPLRMAIKDAVEGFAAVTSTPLHLVTPDAASGSAEGAALMREGHSYKVEDRRRRADGGLAKVIGLSFRFMGDTDRSDSSKIETLWQPAERYSLQERTTSAAAVWGKLPAAAIFTDILQYPPDAVERLQSQRATDLLFQPAAPVTAPTLEVAQVA